MTPIYSDSKTFVVQRDDGRIAVAHKTTLLQQMAEEIDRQNDTIFSAMAADALADVMLGFSQPCKHQQGECYCNLMKLAIEGKRFVQVITTEPIEC